MNKTTTVRAPHLHLVAFDVPYPPNYGGTVDVFFKLRSLHEAGIKIIYHVFYYNGHNRPNDELKKYCTEIYYYKRNRNIIKLIFGANPYVVNSRNHPDLLKNLLKTDDPILFDGLQTCFFLSHPDLAGRKKYVRANNVEHTYYRELAKVERSRLKRIYLDKEADRLEIFEPELKKADALFVVANMDLEHFGQYSKAVYVPPFFNTDHARREVNKSGVHGRFILFQGNLRIRENELAAKFIINEIAPLIKHKIVIAGKSPSNWLKNEASIEENVQLFDTPPSIVMDSLIQYAHINLLITFQQTGIKLKLLHALDSGKHIIINSHMDDNGIFAALCHVRNTASEFAKKIEDLMKTDFTDQMAAERHQKFSTIFDNRRSAKTIIDEIFGSI
jgi:hypothetical protein